MMSAASSRISLSINSSSRDFANTWSGRLDSHVLLQIAPLPLPYRETARGNAQHISVHIQQLDPKDKPTAADVLISLKQIDVYVLVRARCFIYANTG